MESPRTRGQSGKYASWMSESWQVGSKTLMESHKKPFLKPFNSSTTCERLNPWKGPMSTCLKKPRFVLSKKSCRFLFTSPPSIDVEVFEVLGQGHAVTIQFFHFFTRLDVKIPQVAWNTYERPVEQLETQQNHKTTKKTKLEEKRMLSTGSLLLFRCQHSGIACRNPGSGQRKRTDSVWGTGNRTNRRARRRNLLLLDRWFDICSAATNDAGGPLSLPSQ